MRRLSIIFLFLFQLSSVFAQNEIARATSDTETNVKMSFGAFLTTRQKYNTPSAAYSADHIYHFDFGYTKTFNNTFSLGLGPRLDYYNRLLVDNKDAWLTTIYLQTQLNFRPQVKTLYVYLNYGIGPKMGGNFYAGNVFDIGMGWQYKPKFIDKKLHFSLGYNSTNLKNVYSVFYSSGLDFTDITMRSGYYKLNLSSLALNLGLSF